MRFNATREITAVFQTAKKCWHWHAFGRLLINLIQTWYDDRCYCTLHFNISPVDLDHDSRSQKCKKTKPSVPIISQSFQMIWSAVETCCCDEPHTHFILSILYLKERTVRMLFHWRHWFIGSFSDSYRQIYFRLGMMIEITKLCILISVGWLWPSFKVTVVWETKSLVSIFLQISVSIWMKFSVVPQPVDLFKLLVNLICTSTIQEKILCWRFMKYMFNLVLCQDNYEWICFKLGMVLSTTELNSLIPVWMTFMFTQDHRVMGNLELVQSFCCKVAWSSSNVHDGWYCKADDCEKVL